MHLHLATALSLLGSLLFGLGFCAALPPFEGFDEPAHYSYIQQIAETGTRPRMTDPLSTEVEDYLRLAPGPASNGQWQAYKALFEAPPDVIGAVTAAVHAPRDPSRGWRAGTGHNWEGQHPPLYYALLAPAYSLSKGWSLDRQLIALRGMSYFLAWAALVIAVFSVRRGNAAPSGGALVMLAPAVWPMLIPMWFPEMARLGNDSLVVLLAAIGVVLAWRAVGPQSTVLDTLLLGAVCGLGLLTKATFLPVIAAFGLALSYRAWKTRRDPVGLRDALRAVALFSLATIVVAGWWYAMSIIETGSIVVSHDDFLLEQKGGFAKSFPEHFGWGDVLRNLGVIAVTFVWGGTWSVIPTPLRTILPLLILVAVIAFAWIWHAWRARRITVMEGIALLALAFFIIGLLQANLVNIAANGMFAIPSWYLHSLVPIFAPLLGYGLAEAAGWRAPRPLLVGLLIYPLLFLPFATVWLLSWYAGCFDWPDAPLHLTSAFACGLGPSALFDRLAVIANPALAIPLLVAGWLAMVAGVVLVVRRAFVPSAAVS